MADLKFEDIVLDWMNEWEIRDWYHTTKTPDGGTPTKVLSVNDLSSDYADGDTENGFAGSTELNIRYLDREGRQHAVEIKMGSLMGELWQYMLSRVATWKEREDAGGTG
jgi:hypothetical protein